MYKFEDHIKVLIKLAQNSCLQYKHSACLIQGERIISLGYNKYIKKNIIQNQIIKSTIHAEIDALCKIDSKYVRGMDILIIRVCNSKKLGNSRPCNSCIDKLCKRGIRKVYYSNKEGDIVSEFIDSMPRLHVSSGYLIKKKILIS